MIEGPGFENLRCEVRRQQDSVLADERSLQRVRGAVGGQARAAVTRARRRRISGWLGAGLATCAAGAAALLLVLRQPSPLTFTVAGKSSHGAATFSGASVPVEFSDGSRLLLEDGAARVVGVGRTGASIVLRSGRLRAEVVHRRDTRWSVRAGRYEVRVVGTRFQVLWEPASGKLAVDVEEGEVTVAGPDMEPGKPVHAGERLELPGPVNAAPAMGAAHAIPAAPSGPAPAAIRPHGRSGAAAQPVQPTWRALAASERWAEALDTARRAGFAELCRNTTREELLLLGNTARFGGEATLAVGAFSALRDRFPRSPEAAMGAFALGRLAFDGQRDYSSAARWFRTYLAELPGGALEREAAGRLIEALQGAGDHPGARAAARRYLEGHPDGPHARVARSIIGE